MSRITAFFLASISVRAAVTPGRSVPFMFINYDKLFTYKDFSGIRNEEDYLITENGARLLGKKIPVRAEEVEAIRK